MRKLILSLGAGMLAAAAAPSYGATSAAPMAPVLFDGADFVTEAPRRVRPRPHPRLRRAVRLAQRLSRMARRHAMDSRRHVRRTAMRLSFQSRRMARVLRRTGLHSFQTRRQMRRVSRSFRQLRRVSFGVDVRRMGRVHRMLRRTVRF